MWHAARLNKNTQSPRFRRPTSIGVKVEPGGSIQGGFFKLKRGSDWHHGFLTNCHVVKPPDSSPQSDKEATDLYGARYGQGVENDPTKTSSFFAVNDEVSRAECDTIIAACRVNLDKYEAAILQVGLEPRPGVESSLAAVKETEKKTKLDQEKLQRLPIKLGDVLVSSGRAGSVHKRILDWAFVAMDDNPVNRDIWKSSVKNQCLHKEAQGMHKHSPYAYGNHDIYAVGDPPKAITGYSSLQMGEWYFEVGRTTGITTGVCHGTKIILSMSGNKDLYSHQIR
ncbi:hypothetical protein MMC07_004702 [Pseudocyphellaria aurata]|nr:hypothetical protein [Pseudocyphellaria aurata]